MRRIPKSGLVRFQGERSIRRELARDGGNSEQLEKCLDRCRRLASELGDFRLSHEFASELWEIADDGTLDAGSPSTSEYLISRLVPLMRCQLEFGAASDADRSAARLAQLVDSLLCAFDDSEVDREEEALDSTTLWWCVEGLELIARLRGSQNRARESDAASERAEQVRTQADALQAEEMQDGESGEADEPG